MSGQRAQRGHVARAELAPIRQHRRQRRADLVDAQTQQTVPGSPRECLLQPRAACGFQRQRFAGLAKGEHAVRSENRFQDHAKGAQFLCAACASG